MSFGYCPSCYNQLTEESVMVTKPSEVFKGNNVYMMCKKCQRVVLYNKDRDMMFDLDEYLDDEKVLEEINKLLEDLDPNLEVVNRRQEKSTPLESSEPVQISDEDIHMALSNALLAVNKEDVSIKKIFLIDDLNDIDINGWIFFELQPVKLKPVVSYEIERI